ncbi:hypothetical protein [Streptomyces sp. NPDC096934]|uniref:hypothetical protein n=1 Tax=Streptomyces sp. NPDC096934 TaxID=3155551 RepID=UPI00331AEB9F
MPGGQKEAYDLVEPILKAIAAKVGDDACRPGDDHRTTDALTPSGNDPRRVARSRRQNVEHGSTL